MSKRLDLSVVLSIALLLVGCGGSSGNNIDSPSSSNEENQLATQIQCQVENDTVIVGDGETCQDEETILTCNDGKVELNGLNAKLININGKKYTCASNYTNIIEEPKTIVTDATEQLLNGKTLYSIEDYSQIKNNEYSVIRFENDMSYFELYNQDDNTLKDKLIYGVTYDEDIITLISQDGLGYNNVCKVNYYLSSSIAYNYQFDCTNDQGEVNKGYLTENLEIAKQYPVISVEERTLQSNNIVNDAYITQKINVFSIESNRYIENNRAEIDNYFRAGLNKINIELTRSMFINEHIYIFFHQEKAQNIQDVGNFLELTNVLQNNITFEMKVKESGVFEYSLNGSTVRITDIEKFSSFPVEAYLNIFVCQDATLSFETCNYAYIPVKLY